MKITSEIMQAEIDHKLPTYYSCGPGQIATVPGHDGLWFSMCFIYPGATEKYVWVSVNEDMTPEEIDQWSTDAVIQIKTTQLIKELEDKAEQLALARDG